MKMSEESSLPASREVDVEAVVHALSTVDHESSWDRVLAIGRIVFEGIVAGDEEQWRSRRGHKNVSLRKLVRHARCPFKKSALSSAVNVHLFVRARPSVVQIPGITPTHVALTLSLESGQAFELLRKAASSGWSVRELGTQVRTLRREGGERRGRPASSAERRAEALARRAAAALRSMQSQLRACASLDGDSTLALRSALAEISELVARTYELPGMGRRSDVASIGALSFDEADVASA